MSHAMLHTITGSPQGLGYMPTTPMLGVGHVVGVGSNASNMANTGSLVVDHVVGLC